MIVYNLPKKIFRKIARFSSLYKNIPIEGYLTKKEEKKFNLSFFEKIDGWFSAREGIALFRLASSLSKNGIAVEIGSWKGRSTYAIASGLDNSSVLYAIDPFNASGDKQSVGVYKKTKGYTSLYSQFLSNMKKGKVFSRVKILKGYSKEFYNDFNKIDLLFIDANHSTGDCLFDYEKYSKCIPVGGFIAFHDYYKGRKEGPTWVIDHEVIPSGHWKFISLHDYLWIGKRII